LRKGGDSLRGEYEGWSDGLTIVTCTYHTDAKDTKTDPSPFQVIWVLAFSKMPDLLASQDNMEGSILKVLGRSFGSELAAREKYAFEEARL